METARILVVDDDAAVREAVCEALIVLGYTVEPAAGAGEALDRFHPGRYRAVVTDLAMPRMNGLQLARRLRALEPGLPILIFSGSVSAAEWEIEAGGIRVARKPDVEGLTRLVEKALGAGSGPCSVESPS